MIIVLNSSLRTKGIMKGTIYFVYQFADELNHSKKIRSANIGSFTFNALKSDSQLSKKLVLFTSKKTH